MTKKIKSFIKVFYILFKIYIRPNYYFEIAKSQHDNKESDFLESLHNYFNYKSFLEIGFHYYSYNCLSLVKNDFEGVLVDAGRKTHTIIMKLISLILKKKLSIKNFFVKKDNINKIINKKKFGVISIDIDGNDYWILKEILNGKNLPEMFIVEYNPSFLNKSITIVYEDKFDRFNKHESAFYHGASLCALYKLLNKYNYHLVKTIGGGNAFFVNTEFLKKANLKSYLPHELYEEGLLRNKWSKKNASEQFDLIKHLPFLEV